MSQTKVSSPTSLHYRASISILPTPHPSPYTTMSPYSAYPSAPWTFLSLSPLTCPEALLDYLARLDRASRRVTKPIVLQRLSSRVAPRRSQNVESAIIYTRPSSKSLTVKVPHHIRHANVRSLIRSLKTVDRNFKAGGTQGTIKLKYLSPVGFYPPSDAPSFRCSNYRQPPKFMPSLTHTSTLLLPSPLPPVFVSPPSAPLVESCVASVGKIGAPMPGVLRDVRVYKTYKPSRLLLHS